MKTVEFLLVFLLLWCQTKESLYHKRVTLGENVTLDCQMGVRDIYWVFQKLSDSPVLILRTFSSESTAAHILEERLRDKYSSLTLSRLFISNITRDELGIYYCAKVGIPLQLSNGTRVYINEAAQDQNQTEPNDINETKNKSQCPPTAHPTLTLLSFILIIVMCLAVIGLVQIKQVCKKRQGELNLMPINNTNDEFTEVEFRQL